jgi:hypothetical protein
MAASVGPAILPDGGSDSDRDVSLSPQETIGSNRNAVRVSIDPPDKIRQCYRSACFGTIMGDHHICVDDRDLPGKQAKQRNKWTSHEPIQLHRIWPECREWTIVTHQKHILQFAIDCPDFTFVDGDPGTQDVQIREIYGDSNLLIDLAQRPRKILSSPIVPPDGGIQFAGKGVLAETSPLKRQKRTCLVDSDDPDVDCPMPVTVAMNHPARFGPAGNEALGSDDIEEFARILREAELRYHWSSRLMM